MNNISRHGSYQIDDLEANLSIGGPSARVLLTISARYTNISNYR